ncbi:DUF3619 family protein [Massilia arenosa]|uniref:DUF3619 family protein n=1 Tax=Zemynaea arenosa TaxID=2561931 RepID=A0A4Y9S1R1_9BURK|nr:DUF3619 family protein [Massilia arenosa]TFW13875.1 DUF3619 family protein [Massilia arenosa]
MNTDDLNFAYKVRHALNDKLDQLPSETTDRLAAARQAALARKKADKPVRVAQRVSVGNVLTAGGRSWFQDVTWLGRLGVAVPLVAMAFGLAGIYQYEQKQRIAEIAELDAAVLSDELPLTAYLDQGFNAYVSQQQQQEQLEQKRAQ